MKYLVAVTGAVLAWAALATGGIQAQDADRKDPAVSNSLFERLDTDKDGKVTKDELPEDRQRLFERLVRTADKNGDGQLTADEFAAGRSGSTAWRHNRRRTRRSTTCSR